MVLFHNCLFFAFTQDMSERFSLKEGSENEIQYGNIRILPPVLTNNVSLFFTG